MTAVEPTTPTNTPTTGPRSRRDVLCGLMVALVAPGALVAACSDGGSSSGGTADGTTGGGATPTGGGGGAQGLAALADVPDGGGLIVDNPAGGKILLARTGDEVKAYNAACTHMGTIVGAPTDGVTVCPSHGSEFDTETGAVKKGPATQPLPTVEVQVEGDQIVLA
ncbi:Rieske (2Fe-2S) protein [Actinophytocola glycyrrhizae]|uniref:Cytochrome bc1 complex Rieske iron-sulfur subunit n=1 Tax=Actinophytocola glycyrrhizae TaxID=2044873 RepID=A0ABV9S6Z5_9PSEU